jgi:hypothetical protein
LTRRRTTATSAVGTYSSRRAPLVRLLKT